MSYLVARWSAAFDRFPIITAVISMLLALIASPILWLLIQVPPIGAWYRRQLHRKTVEFLGSEEAAQQWEDFIKGNYVTTEEVVS